jgi:hypothetical protein
VPIVVVVVAPPPAPVDVAGLPVVLVASVVLPAEPVVD